MTEQAVIEDEELDLAMDGEPEQVTEDEPEAELADEPEAEEEDEELVVLIGEEPPPQEQEDKRAPPWVREVRTKNRELSRENRELRAQLEKVTKPRDEPQLGPKPTLESVDYDTAKFEAALDAWKERKAAHDRRQAEQQEALKREEERWQSELNALAEQKSALKVKDWEEVEATIAEAFNQTQLGILIDGAQNKALLMYALGKNEKALKELSGITNPVKFAFAVARMETQLKTQSRKPAASPEKTLKGSAPVAANNTLERLRAEAEKTGDFTKVIAYKKQLKQKGS